MSFTRFGLLSWALLAGCDAVPAASAEQAPSALRVRAAAVEALPSHRPLELHGVTRAVERGTIGFTVAGRLAERPVDVGDPVVAGQVLARLDPAGLHNARLAADGRAADLAARLAQLGRDRARLEALGSSQSVSPAELERIRAEEASVAANLDAARAAAAEAARQQAEGVLRAPFAGVIADTFAEPGEIVASGAPIVALTGAGAEIELQVPERVWAALTAGDAATVALPALGHHLDARLGAVSGAAAPGGLFPVIVALDEPVAAGLTATVTLRIPNPPGLSVPVRALVDPVGRGPVVYRVADGAVERVPVVVGPLLGDRVAVRADLAPEDEVVVAGHARLLDGDRVEVLR